MKKYKFTLSTILIATILFSAAMSVPASAKQNRKEKNVLKLINLERTKRGFSALSTFPALEKAVDIRANELIETFEHTRPNGMSCFSVIDDLNIGYFFSGENIAVGQKSASEVVNGWMNSSGHRENIMSSEFIHLSNGYVRGGIHKHNWAQIFVGGCTVDQLCIKNAKKVIKIKPNKKISSLKLRLNVHCDLHGWSHVPINDHMCTGFRPKKKSRQSVRVHFAGHVLTQSFKIIKKRRS